MVKTGQQSQKKYCLLRNEVSYFFTHLMQKQANKQQDLLKPLVMTSL